MDFESQLPLTMHPDFIAEPVDKQMLKVISGSVTGAFACVELVPLTLHQQSVNLIFLGQLSKNPDESSRIFLINGQGVKLLQAFGWCKRHVLCCMVCMFVLLRS